MSTPPKVAVITRTHNRPIFLERAIQSIHHQTYENFVHVIINDAGDSKSVDELIEKYKDLTKDRIKVIHNTESKGMEAASNKAIKSVDSTYVAIHDDDDTWHPDFLSRAVEILDNGAAGVVVRTDKVIEEISNSHREIHELKTTPWLPDMRAINLYRQCIDNQMTPIAFIYRRNILDEVGYYDESLAVTGDWEFGVRFLLKYDVEFLDPGYPLAFYHHRKYVAGSSSNNSFGQGSDRHRYFVNKVMNRYLREELADGRLGIGFIMSSLKYNNDYMIRTVKTVLPTFLTGWLKKKI